MSGFKLINGQYVIDKDPRAELDYGVRMTRWLVPGDALDPTFTPMWEISAGLVLLAEAVIDSAKTAMVKLGGGTIDEDGTMEWARCTWRTTQGRVEQQTLWFNMREK